MPIISVCHHDNEGTLFNTDCTAGSLIAALTEVANSTSGSIARGNVASGAAPPPPMGRYRKVELLPLSFVMDLANNTKVTAALAPHRELPTTAAAGVAGTDEVAEAAGGKGGTTGRPSASLSTSSSVAALNQLVHNVPFSGLLLAPVQQLATDTLAAVSSASAAAFGSGSGGHGNAHTASAAGGAPNSFVLIGCREAALASPSTSRPSPTTGTSVGGGSTGPAGVAANRPHSSAYPSATAGGASSAARMLKQQQSQRTGSSVAASAAGAGPHGAVSPSHVTAGVAVSPTLPAHVVSQLLHQAQTASEAPTPFASLSADAANAAVTAAEVAKLIAASSPRALPAGGNPHKLTLMTSAAATPGAHDEDAAEVVSAPKLYVVPIEEEEKALLERVAAAATAAATVDAKGNSDGTAPATTDAAASAKTSGANSGRQSSANARRRTPSTKRNSSVVAGAQAKDLDETADDDPNNLVGKPPAVESPIPLSQAATRLLHANTAAASATVGGSSGRGSGASVQVSLQTCNVTVVKGSGGGASSSSAAAGATGKAAASTPHVLEQLEAFDVLWRGPHGEHEILRAFLQEYMQTLKQRFEAVQGTLQSEGGGGGGSARRSTVGTAKSRKK